jgi:hypothetical protein
LLILITRVLGEEYFLPTYNVQVCQYNPIAAIYTSLH